MYQLSYHLLEIRLRVFYLLFSLILTLLTTYYYQIEILYIIGRPFLDFDHKFICIDLTEAFYTVLRICGIMSFLMILPFFAYHFWSFYIPSRYHFERKSINKLCFVFFCMLFIELVVLYFIVFPKICEFLLSFEIISSNSTYLTASDLENKKYLYTRIHTELDQKIYDTLKMPALLELTARLESYVKLTTRFFFVMLTLFQIPFFVIILYNYNVIDCYILCKIRKFFFFSSLLISAFISPPDIISQSILAISLFFLYEFLVFVGIFLEIKK